MRGCLVKLLSGLLWMAGLAVLPLHANAQAPGAFPLHRIPVNGSLTQNSVTHMLQDRSGLMWFGTLGGVNVYDGYQFRAISSDPRDPDSLSGVMISRLFEDRDGNIWISGFLGWLDRMDPRTGRIRHFPRSLFGPADRPANFGNSGFHQDDSGALWVGTTDGLHRIDPLTGKVELHLDVLGDRPPLRNIRTIASAGSGKLWLGTATGLLRFDPKTRAIEEFVNDPADPLSLPGDSVTRLFKDRDGTLWIGTGGGLARWNGEGRGFTRFVHDPADPHSIGGNAVMDILRDQQGRFWVACQTGGGLNLMVDGKFQVFRNNSKDPESIAVDDVWSLFEDRSGLLWIGTAGLGLNQLNPSTHRFHTLRSIPFNPDSLRSSFVWDIQESRDKRLWLATLAGLESYDPATQHAQAFTPLAGAVAGNQMQSVLIDRAERFWVGSVDGHLYRFDRASGRFTVVRHPDISDDRFSTDRIWYFGEAADGRIWVSTATEIVALDPESAAIVERIPASARMPLGPTSAIRTSLVDSDGTLWLGGGGVGLIRYEKGMGITAMLGNDPTDPHSLSDINVRSLHESADGTLWVGTQNGLNRMSSEDRQSARNRFSLVTTREGLPNNTIYGILPGAAGTLWLSTNRGLSHYDPRTRHVQNFDARDGLAGDETNGGAELRSAEGKLYFGGVDGLSWFDPANLPYNSYVPQVRISGIDVAGRPLDEASTGSLGRLSLAHGEDDVALSFASMDFHQPEKNRFRYRLDGKSQSWVETDRHSVNLAKLGAGDYVFEVQGSNNDGVWSRKPARIDISVAPPPWRTPWALVLYLLAALGLLALYDRAQRRKLAREREFNETLASANTLVEANHQLALRHAQFDNLTQLPNRSSLLEALGRMMRASRAEQRQLALLLVNLDRFQRINDTIGHNLGDHVLRVTADRLQSITNHQDLLARVGSDEFAIITARPEAQEEGGWLDAVARRVVEAIALPHVHHDPPLSMTASIGVALYEDNEDSASDLLGFANIALHAAKRGGGNAINRYVPGMMETVRERLSIEGRMHRALEAGEFFPYYQPLVDLSGLRLAGFEALIRWQPPGRAMIFPDQFIPVAEESGLIVELGNLMLRHACRQIAAWQRKDVAIAVNVSMRQLRSGTLMETIREAIAREGIAAECLKLEITESVMMENVEDTAEQLRRIKALGVKLSVDDFGTGFSSLSHLKMLPVDEMKIDRSFISDVASNRHSQKIVASIVRLAHELQLRVVAEGVEDEGAVAYLRSIDCDLAQGYLFGRPQPAGMVMEKGWLEAGAFVGRDRLSAVG